MKRVSFKMKLKSGCKDEYQKRHDDIWPDLVEELSSFGLSDFYIYWDKDTDILFATYKQDESNNDKTQPGGIVQQKWWEYMKDLMEVNRDYSPVIIPLEELFYMK